MDMTRRPGRESWRRELIDACMTDGDLHERDYLEVKSQIDLSQKTEVYKIAKFVLGAANRAPQTANRHFGGSAVMVLGVQQGSTPGIAPIEALQLHQYVDPYLGDSGPTWDLEWQRIGEARVLFIFVDPVGPGVGAYPCWKQLDKLNGKGLLMATGAVYVRGDGETTTASPQDILALTHRAQQGKDVGPDVLIESGGALKHLPLNMPDAEAATKLVTGYVAVGSVKSTHRSLGPPRLNLRGGIEAPGTYSQDDIEQLIERVTPNVKKVRKAMVAAYGRRFNLAVTNLGSHQSAFQLRMQFPASVRGHRFDPQTSSWNPIHELGDGPWSGNSMFSSVRSAQMRRKSDLEWDYTNRKTGLQINFAVHEFFEGERRSLPRDLIRLSCRDAEAATVTATWVAAGKGGRQEGTITIDVVD